MSTTSSRQMAILPLLFSRTEWLECRVYQTAGSGPCRILNITRKFPAQHALISDDRQWKGHPGQNGDHAPDRACSTSGV